MALIIKWFSGLYTKSYSKYQELGNKMVNIFKRVRRPWSARKTVFLKEFFFTLYFHHQKVLLETEKKIQKAPNKTVASLSASHHLAIHFIAHERFA